MLFKVISFFSAIVQAAVLGEVLINISFLRLQSLTSIQMKGNIVHSKSHVPPCFSSRSKTYVQTIWCRSANEDSAVLGIFFPFLHVTMIPWRFSWENSYFTSVQQCLRTVLTVAFHILKVNLFWWIYVCFMEPKCQWPLVQVIKSALTQKQVVLLRL